MGRESEVAIISQQQPDLVVVGGVYWPLHVYASQHLEEEPQVMLPQAQIQIFIEDTTALVRHNAPGLKAEAAAFVRANLAAVAATPGWARLLAEAPLLQAELLQAIVSEQQARQLASAAADGAAAKRPREADAADAAGAAAKR